MDFTTQKSEYQKRTMQTNESNPTSPIKPPDNVPPCADLVPGSAYCNQCLGRGEPPPAFIGMAEIRQRLSRLNPQQAKSALNHIFGSLGILIEIVDAKSQPLMQKAMEGAIKFGESM